MSDKSAKDMWWEQLRQARVEEMGSEEAYTFFWNFHLSTGLLPDGETLVKIVRTAWSDKIDAEERERWGDAADVEGTILIGWVPAGMQTKRGEKIRDLCWKLVETEIDPDDIPPPQDWAILPETEYLGKPVKYVRIPYPFHDEVDI